METLFKVRKKKDGSVYRVYSVQTILGQGPLGQPTPIVLFLIYNDKSSKWELSEAADFEPIDDSTNQSSTKSSILGA